MEPIDNQKYIARLLDRFLQGDSTLEEEQILADYFRSAADLPAEWEDFRTMFHYFDQGMEHIDYAQQEEAASGLLSASPSVAHRPFRWWLTAAASLLILVGMAVSFHHFRQEKPTQVAMTHVRQQPIARKVNRPSAPIATSNESQGRKTEVVESRSQLPGDVSHERKTNRKSQGATARIPVEEQAAEHPMSPESTADASFEELREAQRLAIHNDVVEAVYELLPDDGSLLHLATDENGAYAIIPTTMVREL